MTDNLDGDNAGVGRVGGQIEEMHGHTMDHLHAELWAFEGEGPPGDDALESVIQHQTEGVVNQIDEIQESCDLDDYTEYCLEVMIEDALKALVAVEMLRGERGKP